MIGFSAFDELYLKWFDCAGIVTGMTAPVLYKRYEHRIKEFCWRAREQGNRVYAMFDDKVVRKIKGKTVGNQQTKQHKEE